MSWFTPPRVAAAVFIAAAPLVTDAYTLDALTNVSHDAIESSSRASETGNIIMEAHRSSDRQIMSIAQVIQKAREAGAHNNAQQTVAKSQASKTHEGTQETTAKRQVQSSLTALDAQMLQPDMMVTGLHAANINNTELVFQEPSYGGRSPVLERTSTRGNPLVWTMSVVYGGLTVLVILLYVVWSDGAHRKRAEKPKADMGLPAGYADHVL
mmetsp:Transcript_56200/g.164208  ORF Transcript_56200/g.164208 Transcript_56200/m.164208 type:complete len:211 (+) Transcript_56200:154-786(+)